ncbi:Ferric reduction oxidase 3 [Nymphaea thermarum]|nr:Ferric reduction oxidase 3 [Nymphaea thermarum]
MSTVFINIPSISTLQWHLFLVTSDSSLEEDELTVVIKSEGSWSEALYQKLSSKNVAVNLLEVAVEGPYGPPSTVYLRHDVLVMISGGVGITPFFSIVCHLLAQRTNAPRLLLVCAFKSSANFTCLIFYSLFPLLPQKIPLWSSRWTPRSPRRRSLKLLKLRRRPYGSNHAKVMHQFLGP